MVRGFCTHRDPRLAVFIYGKSPIPCRRLQRPCMFWPWCPLTSLPPTVSSHSVLATPDTYAFPRLENARYPHLRTFALTLPATCNALPLILSGSVLSPSGSCWNITLSLTLLLARPYKHYSVTTLIVLLVPLECQLHDDRDFHLHCFLL